MNCARLLAEFEQHPLDGDNALYSGRLSAALLPNPAAFEAIWNLHPETYHVIKMHGRNVPTPRWQQAYGQDYHYTGRVNAALPIPELLLPIFNWSRDSIDERLNGVLLNWYHADRKHYIGKHRDSTINMIDGVPIVTVSLGAERSFRLRPWRGKGFRDFPTFDGSVFVMPYATNLAWTHEVPYSAKQLGRRISVTLRGFETASHERGC